MVQLLLLNRRRKVKIYLYAQMGNPDCSVRPLCWNNTQVYVLKWHIFILQESLCMFNSTSRKACVSKWHIVCWNDAHPIKKYVFIFNHHIYTGNDQKSRTYEGTPLQQLSKIGKFSKIDPSDCKISSPVGKISKVLTFFSLSFLSCWVLKCSSVSKF